MGRNNQQLASSSATLKAACDQAGVPQYYAVLQSIMVAESGGNPTIESPTSTASGLFQFIDDTWERVTGKKGPASNYSAEEQCRAAIKLFEQNAAAIKKATGREPTAGDLYLAHFAGVGKAIEVKNAPAGQPISEILDRKAMKANAPIEFCGKKFKDFTAQDLRDWASWKMDAAPLIEKKERGEPIENEKSKWHDLLIRAGFTDAELKALPDTIEFLFALVLTVFDDMRTPGAPKQGQQADAAVLADDVDIAGDGVEKDDADYRKLTALRAGKAVVDTDHDGDVDKKDIQTIAANLRSQGVTLQENATDTQVIDAFLAQMKQQQAAASPQR